MQVWRHRKLDDAHIVDSNAYEGECIALTKAFEA
jgi:hypothetical protein